MTDPATGAAPAPAAGGQQPGQGAAPVQPAPAAAAPTTPSQPAGQPAQQTPPKEVNVPLHVVEAVRSELSQSKTTVGELRQRLQQLEAMQQFAGQPQPAQAPAQPTQPAQAATDPFEGLADDEIVSVKDVRKLAQALRSTPAAGPELSGITQTLGRLQLQIEDPQYETTIRTYLPEMITVNPSLRDLIQRAPNPLMAALTLSKMSPRYQAAKQAPAQPAQPAAPPADVLSDLQKIIENATRPASPGSVGGSTGLQGHDRFKSMSDQEFDQEVARVLGQASR